VYADPLIPRLPATLLAGAEEARSGSPPRRPVGGSRENVVLLSDNMPKLDARTSFNVNQFREIQPVRLGIIVLRRGDYTPIIVLVKVRVQPSATSAEARL
jgi:hypothetical protein